MEQITTAAPVPSVGLSATMQRLVDRTLAADRKGGESLWEKSLAVADARAEAQVGAWGTYLAATGQHERAARRLVAIAERGRADSRFREAIITGWLSFSVGAIAAQADDELLTHLLDQPTPPTHAQMQALTARPDNVVRSEAAHPAAPARPAEVQQVLHLPILRVTDPDLYAQTQKTGDLIMQQRGKCTRPFAYADRLWIYVGGLSGGEDAPRAHCVAVVPVGTIYPPGEHLSSYVEDAHQGREIADSKGDRYVMTGQYMVVTGVALPRPSEPSEPPAAPARPAAGDDAPLTDAELTDLSRLGGWELHTPTGRTGPERISPQGLPLITMAVMRGERWGERQEERGPGGWRMELAELRRDEDLAERTRERERRGIAPHTPDSRIPADWDGWRARARAMGGDLVLAQGGPITLRFHGVVARRIGAKANKWGEICAAIESRERAALPAPPAAPATPFPPEGWDATPDPVDTMPALPAPSADEAEAIALIATLGGRYGANDGHGFYRVVWPDGATSAHTLGSLRVRAAQAQAQAQPAPATATGPTASGGVSPSAEDADAEDAPLVAPAVVPPAHAPEILARAAALGVTLEPYADNGMLRWSRNTSSGSTVAGVADLLDRFERDAAAAVAAAPRWAEAAGDDGEPTVMIRSAGLAPLAAEAIAQIAEALRLLACGEAHAVDTPLLGELARALTAAPAHARGTLRAALTLVCEDAEALAATGLQGAR